MSRVESRSGTVEATPRKRLTFWQKVDVLKRQHYWCATVGCITTIGLSGGAPAEFDHVLPLELGGDDDLDNVQALCIPCHKAKTREDIKRIRKAARLRRDADPETRRKSPRPLRSRGFSRDPLSWKGNNEK
jgi:5-methylcytosine-specific restriction endonuclease McrA